MLWTVQLTNSAHMTHSFTAKHPNYQSGQLLRTALVGSQHGVGYSCRSCRCGETVSLNCGHQRAYCSSSSCWPNMNMEPRCNDTDRGNRRTRRKPCSSATLSTTNPTWIDLDGNPGLPGEVTLQVALVDGIWTCLLNDLLMSRKYCIVLCRVFRTSF
jgi:hypothetical protein